VIATEHREVAPRVGIFALLDVFDPGAVHAKRDVVFFLACHRACMTTDAAVLVDEKTVAHSKPF
jgi:hypothetical protein